MSKKLLVINADQCMEVSFDQQITIGRDIFNSLSLQDIEVSRSHAIVFEQDGETIIKDLKSRNGLYVRGEKVTEGVLKPGDEIILGSSVLIFDPTDTIDLGQHLSKRGRYLIEKRSARLQSVQQLPNTIYTAEQMDKALESILSSPESTTFFSMTNAIMLLQSIKEMDDAPDAARLFEVTLRRAKESLGAHRGVIMETDESKERLKVRSTLASAEQTQTILIAQPVLKLLLGAEKCVHCPNVEKDPRFEQIAEKSQRPVYSFAAVPIKNSSQLFGFIYIESEDKSISYDFSALRTLYFMAWHLGALMRTRAKHFRNPTSSRPRHEPVD